MKKKTKGAERKRVKERRRQRIRRFLWAFGGTAFVAGAAALLVVGVVTSQGGQEEAAITPIAESTPVDGAVGSYQGGPRMRFAVDSVDFGQVPLNTSVSYAFEFSNAGDETLQIWDVDVKMLEGC